MNDDLNNRWRERDLVFELLEAFEEGGGPVGGF